MKIESVIVLVLVFSVITIAVGGIIGDMNNNYNVNASVEFQNQYNFANQINESVSAISTDAQEAGKETGWLSVLSGASAIWRGVTTVVTLILNIPKYILTMIRGVASSMGLPPVVSTLIIPIFILMIIVAIVFMTVRFIRGENV
jgi:hypothetical protein